MLFRYESANLELAYLNSEGHCKVNSFSIVRNSYSTRIKFLSSHPKAVTVMGYSIETTGYKTFFKSCVVALNGKAASPLQSIVSNHVEVE